MAAARRLMSLYGAAAACAAAAGDHRCPLFGAAPAPPGQAAAAFAPF